MGTYYCHLCKRNVEGKKIFHGIAFVLLVLFVWLPLLFVEFVLIAIGAVSYGAGFVRTVPIISIIAFIMLIGTLLAPIVYVVYHFVGKTPRCPICNTKLKKQK